MSVGDELVKQAAADKAQFELEKKCAADPDFQPTDAQGEPIPRPKDLSATDPHSSPDSNAHSGFLGRMAEGAKALWKHVRLAEAELAQLVEFEAQLTEADASAFNAFLNVKANQVATTFKELLAELEAKWPLTSAPGCEPTRVPVPPEPSIPPAEPSGQIDTVPVMSAPEGDSAPPAAQISAASAEPSKEGA